LVTKKNRRANHKLRSSEKNRQLSSRSMQKRHSYRHITETLESVRGVSGIARAGISTRGICGRTKEELDGNFPNEANPLGAIPSVPSGSAISPHDYGRIISLSSRLRT
jgi:hypothetical protein